MRTRVKALKSNMRPPGPRPRRRSGIRLRQQEPVRDPGRRAGDVAIGHHDDEGLGFALGDQVVHDQAGVPLAAPAGFILAAAVLQIQHRIALGRVLVIIRRRVNEAAENGIGVLGIVEGLPQLAMRHVLDGVEVLVLRREFRRRCPSGCRRRNTGCRGPEPRRHQSRAGSSGNLRPGAA